MSRKQLVVFFLATAVVALLPASHAWAGVEPTPFRTGLFGIATGQAIRVSVLNAGNEGGTINPCFNPELAGFVVTISSATGRALFEGRGKAVPEAMGEFTDFDGGSLARTRRAQVRAEIAIELQPIPDEGRCADDDVARRQARRLLGNVHLTLEVYDVATGRTAFTMPFAEVGGINPQPF